MVDEIHFQLGDKVNIDGHDDIEATIIAFMFDGSWKYQLSWFQNGDHKSADWFQGWRLSIAESQRVENYPKLMQK